MQRLCVLIVVCLGCTTVALDTSRLQTILDAKGRMWNASYSLGVYSDRSGPIAIATGWNDRKRHIAMTTANRFPAGSVTKPFTCAMVMQAYEAGLLDLDAPIYRYVDPVLRRLNGTSMAELWAPGNSSLWRNITARMLMGMRAGLPDYNDTWYHQVTLDDPRYDVTPFDLLHRLRKHFVCTPGTCGNYASPSYELLGLALVHVHNLSRWQDLDQRDVVQASPHMSAAEKARYTGLSFPGPGPCSLDPLIVHQYANMPYKWTPHGSAGNRGGGNITYTDIYNNSCLNGWVCGNIASTPLDIARFHYHLHNGKIVSPESVREMMQWRSMWGRPHAYGYGLMETWPPGGSTMKYDPQNVTFTIGHAGDDYGSAAQLAGWNGRYNFGIAMAVNSYIGTNCSMQSFVFRSGVGYDDTVCEIYDEVLFLLTNGSAPRLNCSLCGPGACRSGRQPPLDVPTLDAPPVPNKTENHHGVEKPISCTWNI